MANRSTMVKAAAAASVAGAAVLASATPAMAYPPPTFAVSPSINLVDGQKTMALFDTGVPVYVLGGVVPALQIPVYVCTQPTYSTIAGRCSQTGGLALETEIVTPNVVYETDHVLNTPQLPVKKSWTYVAPDLTIKTQTCTNQCYLVTRVVLPGVGGTLEASQHVVFGAPK